MTKDPTKDLTSKDPNVNGTTPDQIRDLILTSLDDDKAEDVIVIPLAGRTSIADYLVIASGRSTRQVASMADHLGEKLKPLLGGPVHMEGVAQGDWVLVDAGDVIVHLFRPEVRAFYAIEKMWNVGPSDIARHAG